MALNWKSKFRLDIRKTFFFYNGSGGTLEEVVQRDGGCPIPGIIEGQAGWGSEQPDLNEDVPAHCSEHDDLVTSALDDL